MMALMIIAATIEAPRLVQQMKRDREEEMIHRGTEYARAVKKFYKKFGRYPTTLEQLDNTNQLRFLRKRYKDPLSKDGKWTLLHYGDIQTLLNPNGPGNACGRTGPAQAAHGQARQRAFANGPGSDGSGGPFRRSPQCSRSTAEWSQFGWGRQHFGGSPAQGLQYVNGPGSDGGFAGGGPAEQ